MILAGSMLALRGIMMQMLTRLAVVVMVVLLIATPINAATINIGERAADSGSSDDNMVASSTFSGNNWGVSTALFWGFSVGVQRLKPIFRFDLTPIPAGSIITAATIIIEVTAIGDAGCNLQIYGIATANNDWAEGIRDGTAAATGDSTWDRHTHDTVSWAGSAGLSTSGTDFFSTAYHTSSVKIGTTGTKNLLLNATGITYLNTKVNTDGAEFIFNTTTNPDVLHFVQYESGESSTDASRPRLAITYTPPSTTVSQVIMIQLN